MNDLNRFLLTDAAPSGKPLAVNELLNRAEQIVRRQTAGSAGARAELLVAIGEQYRLIDEVERARQVLETAYALAWSTSDPSIRARTACELGQALAKGNDASRGDELVRQGLRELPAEARFTPDRVYCLASGSYVAREVGATSSAIAQATEAQRLLESSPFRSEIQDLSILMDIAESNSQAGRHAESIPAFERAAAIMTSLGRDQTQWAGTLFNNWALSLDMAGRPLDAEGIYRRAIEISRADASDDAVSPMLLVNYGRTLSRLGRLDEAARYVESGYDKGRAAGFEVVVNQALIVRTTIYREQGDLVRAAATLEEVESRLRKVLAPEHPAFATLLTERALLARARGDAAASLDLIDRAYVIAETALRTGGGMVFAPRVLIRRAYLRNAAGLHAEAADDARLALSQLDDGVPPDLLTTLRGDAYLALSQALRAMKKEDDAQTALRNAVKHLESALGPDHLRVRKARELLDAG